MREILPEVAPGNEGSFFVSGLPLSLRAGRFSWMLNRPLVMGILNLTPDSFSDGGCFERPAAALDHAQTLLEAGADLLDIGGESTRPGAQPVCETEEWQRVAPVLRELSGWKVPLSLDTRRTSVMERGLALGVDLINDINALRAPGALQLLASSEAACCLMHMQGEPHTMQTAPQYHDIAQEVWAMLAERHYAARMAGIAADRIVLDPGFGFGKTYTHNLQLFRRLPELSVQAEALGSALLVGISRKKTIQTLLKGRPADECRTGSASAALLAALHGARIVRVHDVRETVDVLRVAQGLLV